MIIGAEALNMIFAGGFAVTFSAVVSPVPITFYEIKPGISPNPIN